MTDTQLRAMWEKKINKVLVGQTIKTCTYLTKEEMKELDWDRSSLCIEFDSGLAMFASQDDEGNGPGAIFTSNKEVPTIPVI